MTTLAEFITKGIEKTESTAELARLIGVSPKHLYEAKAMRRGLPLDACGRLAELINVDRWTIAVASELVTEKNDARRAYLAPFVSDLAKAAGIGWLAIVTLFVTIPTETRADTRIATDRTAQIQIMRFLLGWNWPTS